MQPLHGLTRACTASKTLKFRAKAGFKLSLNEPQARPKIPHHSDTSFDELIRAHNVLLHDTLVSNTPAQIPSSIKLPSSTHNAARHLKPPIHGQHSPLLTRHSRQRPRHSHNQHQHSQPLSSLRSLPPNRRRRPLHLSPNPVHPPTQLHPAHTPPLHLRSQGRQAQSTPHSPCIHARPPPSLRQRLRSLQHPRNQRSRQSPRLRRTHRQDDRACVDPTYRSTTARP